MADDTGKAFIHRSLEQPWRAASAEFPVLLLTGPRQVGKTTLLTHLAEPERRIVSLDDPALRALARRDPALLLQQFPPPLLIDEVQYAPELLPHIKIAVDGRSEAGLFWLTGSQHFHAMRGVSETLAGRVAIVDLLGMSAREVEGRRPDLPPFVPTPERLAERAASAGASDLATVYRRIWLGSFPALVTGRITNRDLFLASYVETYLQRDVRDLAQVGDLDAFHRFVRACAARTGQLLNVSDLARDVDVSVGTARNWLSILEATRQVFLLQPYHTNVTKRLVKRPKLYFLETGLAAYLTEWSSPETLAAGAMAGAFLETYVVAEILRSFWHRALRAPVHYFRDRDGREIDLLVEADGALHAIEIKRGATLGEEWFAPFGAIARMRVGEKAVVCLAERMVPMRRGTVAPVRLV